MEFLLRDDDGFGLLRNGVTWRWLSRGMGPRYRVLLGTHEGCTNEGGAADGDQGQPEGVNILATKLGSPTGLGSGFGFGFTPRPAMGQM
ncbi:hypothetical protein V6N13_099321 [Hibiscus sabdariffa]